ncbi:adenine deaminase [Rahnella aceris]|jgi:adenine deaminase|uniref:Adenine deaminase n=1 Tax=Rahnella sp. (strain Y9602) TaxID=2703885 RepID=A0A0H3FCG2_RAHSY|nr:adenine deaminase C-terminal domain-containing protein [Rahnella aceris]AFE59571.1 adenine deaminase [Rahnella aquatilis HX2]AYA08125.1 adenine deaminase [Rahnella aquatilis]ADW74924.1 Adenine deaminase [Rahnella aceris]AZP52137.1 adenine deaminase [Rahnella aquatilis]MBU9863159.1 adenine deaminase [Rahnella aceris]
MTDGITSQPLRQRAINAALGNIPFDRLLINARVIDMVTGEIREADVGITGNMIASVHSRGKFTQTENVDDLSGNYLSPGLIDTHVHIESSHLPPEKYAEVVVAQGTTTVFWDPHELANVLGVAGVQYAIQSSRNLPLRVICAAPSSVPSTPGLEMSGADFTGQEMQTMLSWPEIAGVAEVMDMHGVLNGSGRMLEILEAGLNSGKLIEGHARGLKDEQLQAYLAAGVTSDHELTSADDALEKLRAGLTLQIRGSHPYLLPDIAAALLALPHLSSQITLCTDDVPPDHLLEKGGLIALIKLLISYGLRAEDVLRMATLNAAIRMQRSDLGLIAAGRTADLIAFDSLENLLPRAVYVGGTCVAQQGKLLFTPAAASGVVPPRDTMRLTPLNAADFRLKIPGLNNGKARLRNIKGARFTQWSEVTVNVRDGAVQIPDGFSLIWVQHRHGRHDATPKMALLEGWGALRGAIATSYSHDAHNLVIIGRDPVDMMIAANQLIASGGGMALSQHGKLLANIDMPIAGMLSDLPATELAKQFKNLRDLSAQVADWEPPYRVFKAIEGTCLACNAGPHLTDLGLTDGGSREIVNPVLEIWPEEI